LPDEQYDTWVDNLQRKGAILGENVPDKPNTSTGSNSDFYKGPILLKFTYLLLSCTEFTQFLIIKGIIWTDYFRITRKLQ